MNFRRDESVRSSVIFVVVSVLFVGIAFSLFENILVGMLVLTIVISFLERYRYISSKAMYKVVFVDELTGLPNQEQMKQVVEDRINNKEAFFLAVFDINNFKIINDLWGYEKGDEHLKFVGEKLKEFSDVFEFACRCENDNFAVVIKNSSMTEAIHVLEMLFHEISCLPDNHNYHVQYACGIVQQDGNYENANMMFDCAKIAKAIGKKENQTQIIIYDDFTKDEMIRRQRMKDNLHEGLKNDEFVVYLQPKYNLKDDTLAGAEALIRWNYKHEIFLFPAQFIPVFEEDGSIGLIDQFVLTKVSEKIREWKEKDYEMLPISVNVSRVQLTNRNLVREIATTVEEQDIPFNYIDLELTESAAFDNMAYLLETMGEIKKAGFKLSMDDFGTGYSSLGLLQKMPLDILKLDKAFMDNYTDENCEKERMMICDIINMAHHLEIKVLAEGVETKIQRDMLKEAGCEVVQGYYYSRPIPIEEYEKLLRQNRN